MLPLLLMAATLPPVIPPDIPSLLSPEMAQRLVDPPRCLEPRCVRGEWVVDAMPRIPAGQIRVDGSALPGAGGRLRLPGSQRSWVKAQGSNARVGLQYGAQMVKTAATSVRVAMEPGYRLQAGADDGVIEVGPVLRGQVEWSHALGEEGRIAQTARLELGQRGAYLRNSVSFVWQLHPRWSLGTGLETRHDSTQQSRNQADMTVKLRYLF